MDKYSALYSHHVLARRQSLRYNIELYLYVNIIYISQSRAT